MEGSKINRKKLPSSLITSSTSHTQMYFLSSHQHGKNYLIEQGKLTVNLPMSILTTAMIKISNQKKRIIFRK